MSAKASSLFGALKVYGDRRTIVILALGFSSGLPNLLIFDTLSAWLRESGLSLEVIGFFSLATLAYSFKFLWAPLVDRSSIPVLARWLGHRRSWMLAAQAAIIVGLWLVAGSDPAAHLGLVALFAVLTGFASATQDIVIDAWRIEAAEESQQGAMAAAYQWGYRLAVVVAGAAPLVLAESYGWSLSYSVMASLMGIGVLAVVFAPREVPHELRAIGTDGYDHRPVAEVLEWLVRLAVLVAGALVLGAGLTNMPSVLATPFGADVLAAFTRIWGIWMQLACVVAGFVLIALAAWPIAQLRTRPGVFLTRAFGEPLADFWARFGKLALLILALICFYRVSDFVLNIMNPFYLDLGFTKTEIAEVRKVFGVVMSMLGVFLGGWAIARYGLLRSLLVGALAGPISNLVFVWLATQGNDLTALFVAIGTDNIASGFAGTCLIAYMSSLTAAGFTATQYALFSSLYSLPGKLIASQSGRIVEGAARNADSGGAFAPLTRLMTSAPSTTLSDAAAKLGVSGHALGTGYVVFFIYSFAIGLVAVALTAIVAAHGTAKKPEPQRD